MTRIQTLLAAAAATLLTALSASAQNGIAVNDAYARVTPKSGAVFFTLVNRTVEDDRLISVITDAAARAEIHTHIEDANGVMQMRALPDGIVIPGLGEHALARGGDHLMLMGLTKPLKQGDVVTLILTFERDGTMTLDVPVDNDRAAEPMGHGTMDHSGHDMSGATN